MGINTVFEALSHPVRRKVLALLKAGPMTAGELASHFEISRPTLSVHFAKLRAAELVVVERRGTSLVYHLNASILEAALASLLSLRDDEE